MRFSLHIAKSKQPRRASRVLALALAFVGAQAASAGVEERYDFYNGVRSLGMGGAYVASVNDETALLTNPAALGRLRDWIFTVADPEVAGSFNDTQITDINHTAAQTPTDLLTLLNQHKGVHWYAKAQVFPSLVAPNIGFGVHAKWKYDAEVNTAGTNYRLDYTNDYAAILGFCFKFWGGILKIGGSGRYVNRTEIHKDINPTVTTIDMNQMASEGAGLASDVGMIITFPVAWLPALAAVVHDAGRTTYTLSSGMFLQTQTRPAETPQTIDVGYALHPILSNNTRMTITADYRDVANAYNETDTAKKIHAGLEFNFADFFFVRGGYYQRYWTAGLELSTELFQLQAASYGEEIGTLTANKEDRRWVGKFSVRF